MPLPRKKAAVQVSVRKSTNLVLGIKKTSPAVNPVGLVSHFGCAVKYCVSRIIHHVLYRLDRNFVLFCNLLKRQTAKPAIAQYFSVIYQSYIFVDAVFNVAVKGFGWNVMSYFFRTLTTPSPPQLGQRFNPVLPPYLRVLLRTFTV